jgi:hypothetical protein
VGALFTHAEEGLGAAERVKGAIANEQLSVIIVIPGPHINNVNMQSGHPEPVEGCRSWLDKNVLVLPKEEADSCHPLLGLRR